MTGPYRADLVSARTLGLGVGLLALQMTWLITNRLTALIWGPPVGPTVAFVTAILTGIAVTAIAGKRLVAKVVSEAHSRIDIERRLTPTVDSQE